jgi:tRNA(fMet)-specific endonuclease VapC
MDILIAGIALAHGRIVVTCNTKHFNKLPGLTVEDWTL